MSERVVGSTSWEWQTLDLRSVDLRRERVEAVSRVDQAFGPSGLWRLMSRLASRKRGVVREDDEARSVVQQWRRLDPIGNQEQWALMVWTGGRTHAKRHEDIKHKTLRHGRLDCRAQQPAALLSFPLRVPAALSLSPLPARQKRKAPSGTCDRNGHPPTNKTPHHHDYDHHPPNR